MREAFCPKCDDTVSPKWHACCSKKQEDVEHGYVYSKGRVHSDKEHLHYYCKCGYDFITGIDEAEVIEL